MAGTGNQTCSSSSSSYLWDVFLSFRGEDIRKTFVDHLYTALDRAGIQTFKDDPQLRKGEEISSALLNAIQDSRMSIVVFSKNYASSRWCLDELAKIVECKRTKGQTVHPVFYDVDPSEVRHQLGSFGEAIEKHELRFMDKVKIWRDALTEASNISGYHLKNDADGHESKFIQKIVNNVLLEVNPKALIVDKHLVGVDSHVEDVYEKICIGSSNLRVVGIHGMGGVGKTTIAKAFYNKYFHCFERSCFLENVREASQRHDGPLSLVQQLISALLEKQDFATVDGGISILKERVLTKKVLIVLDDLDESSQSKLLVSCWNFFGPESRIIITTRDTRMLVEFEKIDEGYMVMPYMVETLDKDESLELFSYHAFRGKDFREILERIVRGTNLEDFREILERIVRGTISEDFIEIFERIVSYTGGLPLALKVLGSLLYGRTKEEWTSTLKNLQQIPNNKIQQILKISYDALDSKEKQVFLDVVLFLYGMDKEEANHILDSSDIGIKVLEERCLLTTDRENKFRMHDLIRDMAREIVRQESTKPGKRSRLWCQKEACDVLKKQKGTEKIEGIRLDFTASGPEYFDAKTFEIMPNLRLLQINNVHLTGSFENSFEELRWLCWRYCPLTCLPPSFHASKLVSLDLKNSKFSILWEGTKHLKSLKFLNASYTPIERLPDSIGLMTSLVKLFLKNCKSLRSLPNSICNLSSLKKLNLAGCSELVGLPVELGNMISLQRLNASGTAIEQLPDSVGHLSMLVSLELSDCNNLRNLPNNICNLSSLEKLNLCATAIEQLPDSFGHLSSLEKLNLCATAIEQLPDSFGHLSRLVSLDLSYCRNLKLLPVGELMNMKSLWIKLCNCRNLKVWPVEELSLERVKQSAIYLDFLPDWWFRIEELQYLMHRGIPSEIAKLLHRELQYLMHRGIPSEIAKLLHRGIPSEIAKLLHRGIPSEIAKLLHRDTLRNYRDSKLLHRGIPSENYRDSKLYYRDSKLLHRGIPSEIAKALSKALTIRNCEEIEKLLHRDALRNYRDTLPAQPLLRYISTQIAKMLSNPAQILGQPHALRNCKALSKALTHKFLAGFRIEECIYQPE